MIISDTYQLDETRLKELFYKLKSNSATVAESSEYLDLLFKNGSISQAEYNAYKGKISSDETQKILISIGLGILLAIMLAAFLKNN